MDLFQNLSAQTTVLTPNRRLAAVILEKYNAWQKSLGHLTWPTLDILPLYPSWLERTLNSFLFLDLNSYSQLLTLQQEHIIWEKILRDTPDNQALLQISEAARLAKSAWETLKRWTVSLDEPNLRATEDSRAFLRWAEKFQKHCKQKHWIDQNSMADVLIDNLQTYPELTPKQVILIGFTDIAPQYQRLLQTLEKNGCRLEQSHMPVKNESAFCMALTDTETEIQTMAYWAKKQFNHAKLIGCIVPNLETVREQVVRIFSNTFAEGEFNISAGKNLTQYPVIQDALHFLQLPMKSISLASLSRLLKSPYLGEAERERNKRALFDLRLYQHNVSHTSLDSLLEKNNPLRLSDHCPALAQRLQNAFTLKTHSQLPIDSWIQYFCEVLTQLGWPGERSLNSHEYQVVQHSWLPLLNQYSACSSLLEPMSYSSALHYLNLLANNTVFQPESPKAPVQVLGLLEAADIPFDSSWVMGLDDVSWPPRPRPNPFIPLRLQKSLNMPNASATRELAYCQTLTQQLQNSSQHIIFSHPVQKEAMELRPSALLKHFPMQTTAELSLEKRLSTLEQVFATRQLERICDDTAPTMTEEEVLGGVKIFKTQAECPFKAFSELRLHAKRIDEVSSGLRKLDRGTLMHKALELLWSELKGSENLIKLSHSEISQLVHQCAEQAIQEIVGYSTAKNKRYLALECQRVEKLLLEWLEIEKTRPPFKVIALEKEITTQIGKITARFRLDRVDELSGYESHNQLIIDYKTGKAVDKNDWFGNRLDEPQLPIYCMINPEEIMGIAFAKINPSKMELVGISREPLKINSINLLAQIPQADATLWNEQLLTWKNTLEQLGNDFYQGKAEVNPKDPMRDCRLCGLQSLCRIHELNLLDPVDDAHD